MFVRFPKLPVMLAVFSLAAAASADALLSKRVLARVQARTVEVLCDGQIRGGGGIVSEDGLVVTAAHLLSRADIFPSKWVRQIP